MNILRENDVIDGKSFNFLWNAKLRSMKLTNFPIAVKPKDQDFFHEMLNLSVGTIALDKMGNLGD